MSSKGFAAGADNARAAIFSVAGLKLSPDEKSLFRDSDPLGFILFARNCENPKQLKTLTDDLKNVLGRECPVLIDQEGGRVQRLKPPVWRSYPPMREFGERAEKNLDAALEDLRFAVMQIAEELVEVGINVNCTPVLDILTAQTHEAIGDRAFSSDPEIVFRLGLCVCRNFLAAGITPVMKHMPGQGRASLDSHIDLPVVDAAPEDLAARDFKPFRDLAASDVGAGVWGMNAHIMYSTLDADHPASVSPRITQEIVRGAIGFGGFLVSDDLDMKALARYGDIPARVGAALMAGADAALYCAGDLKTMEKIAESVPKLGQKGRESLQKAAELLKVAA